MARRLLDAGYELAIWNRSASKARALVEAGARLATYPREVAESACIIFICVTDAAAVTAQSLLPPPATQAANAAPPGYNKGQALAPAPDASRNSARSCRARDDFAIAMDGDTITTARKCVG